jgi:uncharacterized protein YndB with AHSA1/START domain
MGRAKVLVEQTVRAPLDVVFDRITDHEAMSDWPGVGSSKLVVEGEPRNGVGAVREVRSNGLALQEKVVLFERPHRYHYTIIKGLPVEHLGTVSLEQRGDGVHIEWKVRLSSKIPLLAQIVGFALQRGLPGALRHFAKQTEAAAAN